LWRRRWRDGDIRDRNVGDCD